jgi:hypothetical protein
MNSCSNTNSIARGMAVNTAPTDESCPLELIDAFPGTDDSAMHGRHAATSLLDLPAEILLAIFHASREPSLIHVCRTLYRLLPKFQDYTFQLLLLAFSTRDEKNPMYIECDDEMPLLPGTKWTTEELSDVQEQVSLSSWLRISHLEKLHKHLFYQTLFAALNDGCFEFRVRDSTKQEFDQFMDLMFTPDRQLKAHMGSYKTDFIDSAEERHRGQLNISDICLVCENTLEVIFFYDILHVFMLPNCLVTHEPCAESEYIREVFVRASTFSTLRPRLRETRDYELRVATSGDLERSGVPPLLRVEDENQIPGRGDAVTMPSNSDQSEAPNDAEVEGAYGKDLLEERLYSAVAAPLDSSMFCGEHSAQELRKWLRLSYACRQPVSITYKMLELCVQHDFPHRLEVLLGDRQREVAEDGYLTKKDLPPPVPSSDLEKLLRLAVEHTPLRLDCAHLLLNRLSQDSRDESLRGTDCRPVQFSCAQKPLSLFSR